MFSASHRARNLRKGEENSNQQSLTDPQFAIEVAQRCRQGLDHVNQAVANIKRELNRTIGGLGDHSSIALPVAAESPILFASISSANSEQPVAAVFPSKSRARKPANKSAPGSPDSNSPF